MSRRFTVALRICVSCGSSFGLSLWPWNGERYTRTHGLCRRCFERLETAFDEERPRRSAVRLAAPSEAL
jgi:ribosomal protein L37E